eukprot:Plantae.Rhodophyta-Palmaria_palmata.ctg6374.p1 GENE.Plantae.Rhodophyta-Palmaria_palmata.ctg6374~~Plantae.Rhodophyta-Palmaria_palmata.ctg6374.p1  ORF type:complete len:184 (-),score=46.19 Plantae.Rhodophyta-Palmaria_palmata.ctg6374:52-603(-)
MGVNLETDEELDDVSDDEPDFEKEFREAWKEWVRYAASIKWKVEFPVELKNAPTKVRIIEHLLPLNIGKLYARIEDNPKYGYLPQMARCSRYNIGVMGAQRFCERVISAANIVMTKGNTLLNDDVLDMLVLRMNRKFMKWTRVKFAHLDVGESKTSEIPEKENEDDEEEEADADKEEEEKELV